MATIGKVTLDGLVVNDFWNTFEVASATVLADATNRAAMTIDATGPNKAKKAGDGEKILGRLEVFEDRVVEGIKVGTISRRGSMRFEILSTASGTSPATLPAPGDYIVGSTEAGKVRKATTAEVQAGKDNWQVVEVYTSGTTRYAVAIDV